MKKICFVATIPAVVHTFLRGHIQAAAAKYQITVVCNSADAELLEGLDARLNILPIERKPSPLRDLQTLIQLFKLFRRERFNIVHSIMPKTGMLAMLAARLAKVPVRVHTFTGQVWVTKHGLRRWLLKEFDWMIGSMATCVLADSPSQRDFLVSQHILTGGKAKVIGAGSICGVDVSRFRPDSEAKQAVREELGIAWNAKLILYLGRLNRDKGLLDLAAAFAEIAKHDRNVVLVLVGAQEDISFGQIQDICSNVKDRLRYLGFTSVPEKYMAASDIFCLPSYREGFGMTIIEAGACGIPTVASRIYGITDAVEDRKTGLLFQSGDLYALTEALRYLIAEDDQRHLMGAAARERALEIFPSEKITWGLMQLYDKLLEGS